MPNCPKCGRPMATVLKREGGVVRTYYQCHACPSETEGAGDRGPAQASDPAPPKEQ
jgi:hypothetical protein